MRWVSVGICVVLLWTGPCWRAGLAQQAEDRPTVRGMFGDRTLGRPLQPAASRFGSGIQRGPSGNFLGLGRADGSSTFLTPWRRSEPAPRPVNWATPPYIFAVPGPQPVIAPHEQPAQAPGERPLPPQHSTPGQPASDIWFRSPSPPSETTTPVTPGSAGRYGPRKSLGWSATGAPGGDSTAAKGPFLPSPGVSARITRLAQAGGVRTSTGMQVCVQGSTATVRGAVATPYQRSLVGNLVGLESGVWHVDNQVIVVAAPGLTAAEATR